MRSVVQDWAYVTFMQGVHEVYCMNKILGNLLPNVCRGRGD
jgi:hypothetical protein